MTTRNVAVIVGSLRRESWNRKIAQAIAQSAPESLSFTFVEIGNLPLYDQDIENDPPKAWVDFRDQVRAADAVLFATAEYNRSIPGCLKNAIDVGSRPYGKSVWSAKPGAVVSASPGAIGGFGANHHLRQCFVFLDVPCMQQPEMYIGQVDKAFDAEGKISNEHVRGSIDKFGKSFALWVERHAKR
jgi:chromate reductase